MQEEDYEVLRSEADAEPERYTQWDTQRQFRSEYQQRHSLDPTYAERIASQQPGAHTEHAAPKAQETGAPLSRQSSSSSSSTSSTSTSASSHGRPRTAELQEIRTQPQTPGFGRRGTSTSGGELYRHPTERNPAALARIETHRSQHAQTVGEAYATTSRLSQTLSRRRTQKPIAPMGAGKPYPPPLPDREEYVVEYDGPDDPLHAQNWPMKKKIFIGAILAFDALSATMGSSIFSSAIRPVSQQFYVAPVVGTLGTSFFVFGYAFGPLVSVALFWQCSAIDNVI